MKSFLSQTVRNSVWTGLSTMGSSLFSFLLLGLAIRWLGNVEAGFAIAVTGLVGMNSTVGGLGLGPAATRLLSQAYAVDDQRGIRSIVGVCLLVSLVFGLLGFGLFALGGSWIIRWSKYPDASGLGHLYCLTAGASFLFGQLCAFFTMLLESFQRFDLKAKVVAVFGLVGGGLSLVVLSLRPNILTFGISQASLLALQSLCLGVILARLLGFSLIPWWDKTCFLRLWSFGKWVYLSQISGLLFTGLDRFCLVSLFGSAPMLFYQYGQRVFLVIHGVLCSQASFLIPMLSTQATGSRDVTTRIEDRLRWFIGLGAAAVYAGILIAGDAGMKQLVGPVNAAKASFQLSVFCWVGYFHANSIVPFFFAFSRGDSRGNWLYQTISGLLILPSLILCGIWFGFEYAVLGGLAAIFGVLYLCWREKPELPPGRFFIWFVSPLTASAAIMVLATAIHVLLKAQRASMLMVTATLLLYYLAVMMILPRIESRSPSGRNRVTTLARALDMVLGKLGLSGRAGYRWFGIATDAPAADGTAPPPGGGP